MCPFSYNHVLLHISGETLLSPLVMCGPHGLKFNVPIELRLPHCASISPDSWSFALKSSDTPNGIKFFIHIKNYVTSLLHVYIYNKTVIRFISTSENLKHLFMLMCTNIAV